MTLYDAHQTLRGGGTAATTPIQFDTPDAAVDALLRLADREGRLETSHPWELAPRVARSLSETTGFTPPGSWARVAGLAAGSGLLLARPDGFVPLAGPEAVGDADSFRTRMVEAFTRRLIPPAAAAALYVTLDMHPVWGLRLGREVALTTEAPSDDLQRMTDRDVEFVKRIVFGTIGGLLAVLRDLEAQRWYPLDQLGDVLWLLARETRETLSAAEPPSGVTPIFVEDQDEVSRRAIATRVTVADLFDFVFVPAGVARRDDSGRFAIDAAALGTVRAGEMTPQQQEAFFAELAWGASDQEAC
jgi:hypothetical protein